MSDRELLELKERHTKLIKFSEKIKSKNREYVEQLKRKDEALKKMRNTMNLHVRQSHFLENRIKQVCGAKVYAEIMNHVENPRGGFVLGDDFEKLKEKLNEQ